MCAGTKKTDAERRPAGRELFRPLSVSHGVGILLRLSLGLSLLACSCQSWSGLRARSDWAALQAAETDQQTLDAARDLCQDETAPVADALEASLGAYAGTDAEAYLAVAVAKARPNGMQWLARRFYRTSLNEAFIDLFDPDAENTGRIDWPTLADALMIGPVGDPEADRWLALMALADDGETTTHVREALATNADVRLRVREALDRVDMPRRVSPGLLGAFGPPANEAESAWLVARYRSAFEHSLEQRSIDDNEEYEQLRGSWTLAFAEAAPPVPERDLAIMRVLRPLLSTDDAPDVAPSFEEVAAFMTRHQRTNWIRVVQVYADGEALPSNALAHVCRASVIECANVLASGVVNDVAGAADVAPALDLPEGEDALSVACSALPRPEARQLAARASGAGMPLVIRESAAACLASFGDDVSALWRELLPQAVAAKSWRDAEIIASIAHEAIDPSVRAQMIGAVRRGEVRALDVPWLLVDDEDGAELVRQAILASDPNALDGLAPGALRPLLAPVAEHVSAASHRRVTRTVSIDENLD
jgi:hypothetical protein